MADNEIKYKVDTSDLDKLSLKYDVLTKKLLLFEDAGKKNTVQYRIMQAEMKSLDRQINTLAGSYTNAEKTQSFFRNRATNLGADLTILSLGVKSVVGDIKGMSEAMQEGSVDMGKLAESAGGATLTLLAMVPAIKAIGVAGLVAIGTWGGALVGLAANIYIAYKQITGLIGAIGNYGKVISGVMTTEQAWKENLKLVTFGLIDLTGASNSVDLSNAINELEILRRTADATAKALEGAKMQEIRRRRDLELTPEMVKFESDFEKQEKELKKANEVREKGNKTSSVGQQIEKETLNLVELKQIELGKLNTQLVANIGNLGAELDLNKKILEVQREITRLKSGELPSVRDMIGNEKADAERELAGIALKVKTEVGEGGRINPRQFEIEEMERIESLTNAMGKGFEGMLGFTQQMLQTMGLTNSEFSKILGMIQMMVELVKGGFNFAGLIGDILSFLPGGGAVSGIAGAVGGGLGGGGMSYSSPVVFAPVFKGMLEGQTVIVENWDAAQYQLSRKNL